MRMPGAESRSICWVNCEQGAPGRVTCKARVAITTSAHNTNNRARQSQAAADVGATQAYLSYVCGGRSASAYNACEACRHSAKPQCEQHMCHTRASTACMQAQFVKGDDTVEARRTAPSIKRAQQVPPSSGKLCAGTHAHVILDKGGNSSTGVSGWPDCFPSTARWTTVG